MCNPRRIEVTATRQVREAWEREVRRAASVSAQVGGEARIRQALDASVGGPALMAIGLRLAQGCAGWEPQPDGAFRHAVEGGHVIYRPDERTLEIVATAAETLTETAVASRTLSGTLEAEVQARGEGRWYDDDWGGHTESRAREEAQRQVEHNLDAAARARIAAAAEAAERAAASELTQVAEVEGRRRLAERAALRQADLERCARERLEEVGIRGRQVFHRLLALGYRDALEGLARRRGVAAEDIQTRETDQYLEIDLLLPD